MWKVTYWRRKNTRKEVRGGFETYTAAYEWVLALVKNDPLLEDYTIERDYSAKRAA